MQSQEDSRVEREKQIGLGLRSPRMSQCRGLRTPLNRRRPRCAPSFLDDTSAHETCKCVFAEDTERPGASSPSQWAWDFLLALMEGTNRQDANKCSLSPQDGDTLPYPPPPMLEALWGQVDPLQQMPRPKSTLQAQGQKFLPPPAHTRHLGSQQTVDSTATSRHLLGVMFSVRLNLRLLFPP